MGETTIRLPDELLERAARLVPVVKERRELIAYARTSKAAVVRLALARGLAELERELLPLEAEGGTDGK
jgi:predicted DNA-binding protein